MSLAFARRTVALPAKWAAALAFVWVLVAPACAQGSTNQPETPVAFVGVNVITMESEAVLANQTVIIRDGKIASIGPHGAEVPEGTMKIDGQGRWLMPGLTEMHGHVPGPDNPAYLQDMLFLYVANGVTTVRNMQGQPSHLALRDRIAAGEIKGPNIYTASPWLHPDVAGTPPQARQAVRDYKAAGYDLIKIGSIPAPAYQAMAEVAHEVGLPFGGHIPADVGLVGALNARQASIDHLDRYVEFLVPEGSGAGRDSGFFGSGWIDLADERRIPDAVQRTVAAATWTVPTLSLVEHLASAEAPEKMIEWPEMRYMPRSIIDGWAHAKRKQQADPSFQPSAAAKLVELRRKLLHSLHEAGAPIALGSDAPQFFNVPGFSIHHEMRMMAAAGLSPYEVLVTGTRNPARYFGASEAFGTIAPGKRADLILLEANPLVDLANMRRLAGVMVRGEWNSKRDIQTQLDAIAARAAQQVK